MTRHEWKLLALLLASQWSHTRAFYFSLALKKTESQSCPCLLSKTWASGKRVSLRVGYPTEGDGKPQPIQAAGKGNLLSERNGWGIQRHEPPPLEFPDTVGAVVEEAFQAITATNHGRESPDPNNVQNALLSDTIHGRRPVRKDWDRGRIGIEIGGATHLFRRHHGSLEASAIRHFSLLLAERLSRPHWEGSRVEEHMSSRRPVILYFNQLSQVLAAGVDLQAFKDSPNSPFDTLAIRSLCDDVMLPFSTDIQNSASLTPREKHTILRQGSVDAKRGVVVIVQPTDFNAEHTPPFPAIGAVPSMQKLVARAGLHGIPVVCISPRFVAETHFDQSGYQQSSSYGGVEPPPGPTPWVLRDFFPPVYSWIGSAFSDIAIDDAESSHVWNSRVCLTQSVLHKGHEWHIFAETNRKDHRTEYLASTVSAAGRPTQNVLRFLLNEFV